MLDSLDAHIAVLDHSGTILAVNQAWRDFAAANEAGGANVAEEADYLQTCAGLRVRTPTRLGHLLPGFMMCSPAGAGPSSWSIRATLPTNAAGSSGG